MCEEGERRQVSERRIEVERKVFQVLRANREATRITTGLRAGLELEQRRADDVVVGEIQRGQVDRILETGQVGNPEPRRVQGRHFGEIACHDAFAEIEAVGQRQIGALAAVGHVDEIMPVVSQGNGQTEGLRHCQAQRRVLDRDSRIHRRTFRRNVAALA